MIRFPQVIVVIALGGLLGLAGCGGGSGSGGGAYGSGARSTSGTETGSRYGGGAEASAGDGTVGMATEPQLGKLLVDSKGFTLYDFHKDQGTASACYGACAAAWPPLTTEGKPQASGGAVAAKLGTSERRDGTLQVTYAGHPLYTYAGDRRAGEASGNDVSAFGGQWYALHPDGEEAEG